MKLGLAAAAVVSLLPAGLNAALFIPTPASFPLTDVPFSGTLSLGQFPYDISLLTKVTLEISASIQAIVTVENNTIHNVTAQVLVIGNIGAVGPSGLAPTIAFATIAATSPLLLGTDGTPGSGPDFHNFGLLSGSDVESDSIISGFAPFVGGGTFNVNYDGDGGWAILGVGNATTDVSNFAGQGTVKVTYEYVPEPHEYAMLAGLGLVGFAAFRRFRS